MLSRDQEQQYREQGFLLVSGLIPEAISKAAESRIHQMLEHGEVTTGHQGYEEPALIGCYTPEYIEAAAQLAEGSPKSITTPRYAYIINSLPVPGPWKWPE